MIWAILIASLAFSISPRLHADDTADLKRQMDLLMQQNAALQQQVQQQKQTIEGLSHRVSAVEQTSTQHDEYSKTEGKAASADPLSGGFNLGKVNFSGEGGIGFFSSQEDGKYPNSEFRVNEARLFAEAPVWDDVYFYGELDLATPESDGINATVGELYIDFEDVSKLWGCDGMLNVRAGNLYIPFGEEYLTRYAIDNPLILNSLSDLWGVNPGVEIYGALGKFSYVAAVQNGGVNVPDYNSDKSVTVRLGYDPTPWLHVSVSGMRTGNLDANNDYLSALWFGNGWFRSIGSTNTTEFHADLVEGDVIVRLPHGQLKAYGGCARYGDNDPGVNNSRNIYYYCVEGVQDLTHKIYAAARFSEVFVNNGYPIPAEGNFNDYFYNELTSQIWRLQLGLGYRFSDRLVLKAEYAFEHGKTTTDGGRNDENFVGTEVAFKF